jgi:hypothetical protein
VADLGADRQALPADPFIEHALAPGPSLAHPAEAGELGPEATAVARRADVAHLVEQRLADEARGQSPRDQDGAHLRPEAAVGSGQSER